MSLLRRSLWARTTFTPVRKTSSGNGAGRREIEVPRRGRLFKFFLPLMNYIVVNVMVAIFWTLFRVFNRTTVIGRGNVGYDRNILLLSNHQTMIDSFLIGSMCFYPQSWWKPYLMPWNPAAVENYYKNAFLAWFSDVHKEHDQGPSQGCYDAVSRGHTDARIQGGPRTSRGWDGHLIGAPECYTGGH